MLAMLAVTERAKLPLRKAYVNHANQVLRPPLTMLVSLSHLPPLQFLALLRNKIVKRFLEVLDANVASVQQLETLPDFSNRPHFMSRRFGEYLAALLVLAQHVDASDVSKMTAKIANLVTSYVNVLRNNAYAKFSHEAVCIPLINNLDLIIAILKVCVPFPPSSSPSFLMTATALGEQCAVE